MFPKHKQMQNICLDMCQVWGTLGHPALHCKQFQRSWGIQKPCPHVYGPGFSHLCSASWLFKEWILLTDFWDSESETLSDSLPEGQLTSLQSKRAGGGEGSLDQADSPLISPPHLLWLVRAELASPGAVWREEGVFVTEKERGTGGQMEWEGPQPALWEKVMHLMYSNGTPDWGAIWSPGYCIIPSHSPVETTFSCRNPTVHWVTRLPLVFPTTLIQKGKIKNTRSTLASDPRTPFIIRV